MFYWKHHTHFPMLCYTKYIFFLHFGIFFHASCTARPWNDANTSESKKRKKNSELFSLYFSCQHILKDILAGWCLFKSRILLWIPWIVFLFKTLGHKNRYNTPEIQKPLGYQKFLSRILNWKYSLFFYCLDEACNSYSKYKSIYLIKMKYFIS